MRTSWPSRIFKDGVFMGTISPARHMRRQARAEWYGYRPFFYWNSYHGCHTVEFLWWRMVFGADGWSLHRRIFGVVPPLYTTLFKHQ